MLLDLLSQYLGDVAAEIRELEDAKVVFRYDNTPHFPDLEGFPHHKHLSDKVTGTEKPSILKVIEEARLLAQ